MAFQNKTLVADITNLTACHSTWNQPLGFDQFGTLCYVNAVPKSYLKAVLHGFCYDWIAHRKKMAKQSEPRIADEKQTPIELCYHNSWTTIITKKQRAAHKKAAKILAQDAALKVKHKQLARTLAREAALRVKQKQVAKTLAHEAADKVWEKKSETISDDGISDEYDNEPKHDRIRLSKTYRNKNCRNRKKPANMQYRRDRQLKLALALTFDEGPIRSIECDINSDDDSWYTFFYFQSRVSTDSEADLRMCRPSDMSSESQIEDDWHIYCPSDMSSDDSYDW